MRHLISVAFLIAAIAAYSASAGTGVVGLLFLVGMLCEGVVWYRLLRRDPAHPAPEAFRKAYFVYFHCPSCGYESWHAYVRNRLFNQFCWCPNCSGIAKTKHAWLIGATWGLVPPLIFAFLIFGPLHAWLGTRGANWLWVPAVLTVVLAMAVLPWFGRLTRKLCAA